LISDKDILKKIRVSRTIGLTAKQLSVQLNVEQLIVYNRLLLLQQRDLVSRVGRNLWIAKKYEKMNADPLFVKPEVYTQHFLTSTNAEISKYSKGITFSANGNKRIHRWSPYIQGFSAEFVDDMLSKYRIGKSSLILDPFCGSGTVQVCAKMKGISSIGIELMPLMSFIAKVKTTWDLDLQEIKDCLRQFNIVSNSRIETPIPFLKKTKKQFNPEVLNNLLRLKQFVWSVYERNKKIGNLFKLAFASILVPSSNLKRAPCLGYVKNRSISSQTPFNLFLEKVNQMIRDLSWTHKNIAEQGEAFIIQADAREVTFKEEKIDIAITSPPYVNGMDYIMNYKIEMAWLELVKSYDDMRKMKNQMVVCDNVSRCLLKNYSPMYSDEWLDDIEERIAKRMEEKKSYRRHDMHLIVRKYFDDIYAVLQNVYRALREEGRFILVIGDSLMAGIYIPADLIIAMMGQRIGYHVEDVIIARKRRSGQRHDFELRESIVILRKGNFSETTKTKSLDTYLNYQKNEPV